MLACVLCILTRGNDRWFHSNVPELIITAGGENIPPVHIEDEIKKEIPFISNVMVVGDHRKYLTCLMTLKVSLQLTTHLVSDGVGEFYIPSPPV